MCTELTGLWDVSRYSPGNRGSIPGRCKKFLFPQQPIWLLRKQKFLTTASGSNTLGTGGAFSRSVATGVGVNQATYLRLVPSFRIRVTVSPLPHTTQCVITNSLQQYRMYITADMWCGCERKGSSVPILRYRRFIRLQLRSGSMLTRD